MSKTLLSPKVFKRREENILYVIFEEISIDVHFGSCFQNKVNTEANTILFQARTNGFRGMGCENVWDDKLSMS
jgi:hypothetical protein